MAEKAKRYESEKQMFSRELQQMVNIAREAGDVALSALEEGLEVDYQDIKGFTTSGDLETNKNVEENVRHLFPGAVILSEESVADDADYKSYKAKETVIIDPIDGTGWYLDGGDLWTVTLAFYDGEQIKYGVTHRPSLGDLWVAEVGKGAYHIDPRGFMRRMVPKSETELDDTKISLGSKMAEPKTRKLYLTMGEPLLEVTRGISVIESTALDLAWVAQGLRSGGTMHPNAEPWDKAAGLLMVREAGGVASGWPNRGDLFGHGLIAAGTQSLYDQLLEIAKTIPPYK